MAEHTNFEYQVAQTIKASERVAKIYLSGAIEKLLPKALQLGIALSLWILGLGLLTTVIYTLVIHRSYESAAWLFGFAAIAFLGAGAILKIVLQSSVLPDRPQAEPHSQPT